MNYGKLFNLKGIRYGYLALAVILNMLWAFGMAFASGPLLQRIGVDAVVVIQIVLLIAAFGGPFLIAWLVGVLAGDRRGLQYGFFGSLGGVGVLLVVAMSAGVFGLMMIVAAISGGFNGGAASLRRR